MGAFLSSLGVRNIGLLQELCLFALITHFCIWGCMGWRGRNVKLITDLVALEILVFFASLPDIIYFSESSHSCSMQSIPIQGLE